MTEKPVEKNAQILTHAEPLKAALVDSAVLVRLAARHADPLRALHARGAVRA